MENKASIILIDLIENGKRFDDFDKGISFFMIDDILCIRDMQDSESKNNDIVNNYFLTLNKKLIKTLNESKKSKKSAFLSEMIKVFENNNFTIYNFVDFIRKMKPLNINNNIMCHRVIS